MVALFEAYPQINVTGVGLLKVTSIEQGISACALSEQV
jgi:hypothetical protein